MGKRPYSLRKGVGAFCFELLMAGNLYDVPFDHNEIERVFDALQNLDRKLDDAKTNNAVTSTLAQVTASKVEGQGARIFKLEEHVERLFQEKADEAAALKLAKDVEKLKEKTQETSIKGGMIWAVIGVAGTVGLEMLLRYLLHIP